MAKYRKKPVVVEAQQWFPPGAPQHDPAMLSHRRGNSVDPPDYRRKGDIFCFAEGMNPGYGGDIYLIQIDGRNDNIEIKPGDWIVTDAQGNKSVCKPGDFDATYEPA